MSGNLRMNTAIVPVIVGLLLIVADSAPVAEQVEDGVALRKNESSSRLTAIEIQKKKPSSEVFQEISFDPKQPKILIDAEQVALRKNESSSRLAAIEIQKKKPSSEVFKEISFDPKQPKILIDDELLKQCENVALSGRSTQSSVLTRKWEHIAHLGPPINAIDGNQDPDFNHGSCTHTDTEYAPWWRVDLLRPHKINFIVITARDIHSERLTGAEILIGNSLANQGNNNPRCSYISGIGPGETQTFHCKRMVGRYVNIVVKGRLESLTLCEVQVFGFPSNEIVVEERPRKTTK